MKLASVILDVPTLSLDTAYHYSLSELEDESEAQVGCCVVVPLGGRKVVGFVVELGDYEEHNLPAGLNLSKLRSIISVASKPLFGTSASQCAAWLAQEYLAPLASCVRLFTPPGAVPKMVRNGAGFWTLKQPSVKEVDDRWVRLGPKAWEFTPRKNALKQIRILEVLKKGELKVAELATDFGSVDSTLKTLEKNDAVIIERRRRNRAAQSSSGGQAGMYNATSEAAQLQLTEGQSRALEAISQAMESPEGSGVLLDGVTGSGKTEVYLQAIAKAVHAGKTAIVLVPEISLTPQTVARFRGRFGDAVAVLHSRMSEGERYDQWDFIASGQAKVVVGARSALFAPLDNLGLIIIDEEHETSYKQESAPRYHARDVAWHMTKCAGGALVLGSATPSIESLHLARSSSRWQSVALPHRANGKPMPEVSIIDMAKEFSGGSRSMFSKALSNALKEELAQGRKAVLFLNQRGFAKFLLCRDCGFVPKCNSCSTSLTFHERGNLLVCHHCGYKVEAPAVCPKCTSPYLKKFGAGTQRVEAELDALIQSFALEDPVPIVRMDADTTKGKGAHEALLEKFATAGPSVLLGTQMIAKGLDFEDVTLVGVIDADTQLHLPDFRAPERTFALIQQVAGRAGRGRFPGRVLVQTYQADNCAIQTAAHYDRPRFLHEELPKRQLLGYPPFKRFLNILFWGELESAVSSAATAMAEQLNSYLSQNNLSWVVYGPAPCGLAKLQNVYRWHLLIKGEPEANFAETLEPFIRSQKWPKEISVAFDVDPLSLL